jgi:hypothetical protein
VPSVSPQEDLDTFMPALASMILTDERNLINALEELRMLSSTGTPFLLRGFTVGGATLFPVLFGPYFASIAQGADGIGTWAPYLLSFLLATTIGSFVSIQEALEDPFDGDTPLDDISFAIFAPPGFSLWRSDSPKVDRELVSKPEV